MKVERSSTPECTIWPRYFCIRVSGIAWRGARPAVFTCGFTCELSDRDFLSDVG